MSTLELNTAAEVGRYRWHFGLVPGGASAEQRLLERFRDIFGSFTHNIVRGYYNGVSEDAFVIEFIGTMDGDMGKNASDATYNYLEETEQESVLITKEPVEAYNAGFSSLAPPAANEQTSDSAEEWC